MKRLLWVSAVAQAQPANDQAQLHAASNRAETELLLLVFGTDQVNQGAEMYTFAGVVWARANLAPIDCIAWRMASQLKQRYACIPTLRGASMQDVLRELETLATGSMTDLGAQSNGSIWSTVRSDIDAGINEDMHISLDGEVLKTLLNSGKPLFYGVLTGSSDEIHEMSRQTWGAFLKSIDHSCEHAVLVFTGPKEQLTVSDLRSLVSGVMQALGISGSTLAVKLVPDPHLPVRLSVLMQ